MNPQYSLTQKLIVPFVLIMLVFAAYLVFRHNPEIMNQEPFYQTLVKNKKSGEARILNPQAPDDFFKTLSKRHPGAVSHRYVEMKSESYTPTPLPDDTIDWVATDQYLIFQGKTHLTVTDNFGKVLWSFTAPSDSSFSPGSPSLMGATVFTATPNGRVYALSLASGKVAWYMNSAKKFIRAPIVFEDRVLLMSEEKANQKWGLSVLNAKTGESIKELGPFELPLSGEPEIRDEIFYFATQTGHLNAIYLANGENAWTSEGSSSFLSGPSLTSERVYLANEDGLILGFDRKNGRKLVEIELGTTVREPLHFVEGTPYALAVDTTGYLVAMDTKAAKRIWRYNLYMSDRHHPLQIHRLTANSLTQLSFNSEVRGWTAWTPCRNSRICIFDVKEGRLLHRIDLKGEALAQFEILSEPPVLYAPVKTNERVELRGLEVPQTKAPSSTPASATTPNTTPTADSSASKN